MTPFSRRELLQSSGSALLCLLARRTTLCQQSAINKPLTVSLARNFPKKSTLDISQNGMNICLDNWGDAEYPLEVVEIGSGKIIYTGSFQTRVQFASFVSDNRALIVETRMALGNKKIVPKLTLVDLQTGQRTEGQHFALSPYEDPYIRVISKEILLAEDLDWDSIKKCSLVLLEFPTYREIIKVSFAVNPDELRISATAGSRTRLSRDRRVFVCSYGENLICRRTEDLEVLWTRKIEPPIGAYRIDSPNENYVAVAIADSASQEEQTVSYISIYNGKTGADIARLPISGTVGFALSPHGNLLAAVKHEFDRRMREYVLMVHIHDVKSGDILASFEHDRIKSQRSAITKTLCGVLFTSDNKHLISSGMNTKVWKLARSWG